MNYFNEEDEAALEDLSRPVSKFLSHIMLFIAIIMIAYGIVTAYVIIIYQADDDWVSALNFIIAFLGQGEVSPVSVPRVVRLPPSILYIVCGILIFLDCRRNFIKSVGLYATCVGFNKIIASIPFIISKAELTFLSGVVILILGTNVTYSGYRMLSGTVRGRNGMLATAIGLLAVYLEYIALLMYVNVNAFNISSSEVFWELLKTYPSMFVSCLMYVILIWLLGADEIRYGDELYRHIKILKDVDNTYRAAETINIKEEDLGPILDPSDSRWTDPRDGGPVEKEFVFESETKFGTTRVIIQKWKDDDRLFFTLSGTSEGTLVFADRFSASRFVPDSETPEKCNHVAILRADGMILTANVIHPPKKRADPIISEVVS